MILNLLSGGEIILVQSKKPTTNAQNVPKKTQCIAEKRADCASYMNLKAKKSFINNKPE